MQHHAAPAGLHGGKLTLPLHARSRTSNHAARFCIKHEAKHINIVLHPIHHASCMSICVRQLVLVRTMEGSWRIAATTELTTMRSARGPRPGTGTLTSPLKLTRHRCSPASSIVVCCALQACRVRRALALHVRLCTSAIPSLTQAEGYAYAMALKYRNSAYAHAQLEDSAQGCCRQHASRQGDCAARRAAQHGHQADGVGAEWRRVQVVWQPLRGVLDDKYLAEAELLRKLRRHPPARTQAQTS